MSSKHQWPKTGSKARFRATKSPGARTAAVLEPLVIAASVLALGQQANAQAAQASTNAPSAATAGCVLSSNAPARFGFLPPKPAWLTDLGVTAKESYDDNIAGVSGEGMKEKSSWITTVTPTLGVNFAPLLGSTSPFQALALGYAPETDIYHNAPEETFTAHRLAQTIKATEGDFSVNLENGFNYIDGSDPAPTYAGLDSNRSAYATGLERERRKQMQDRGKIAIQYDQPKWFVRAAASTIYYDLMTKYSAASGYQNYASRYDANGGLDFGYKLTDQFALTLGYRYGHQYQQQLPTSVNSAHQSATSDYQRALLGIEGKPWHWLTISYQGGPDFRNYEGDSATHQTPVNDFNPITYYGEGNATATLTEKDSLSLRYKQWRWVSSTGKLPLTESLYELGYKRKLMSRLAFDLTGRIQSSDYNCGNVSSSKRDDYLYSVATGLTYTVNQNLSFNLSYALDLGRNQQDNVSDGGYREYDHQLVSLGMTFKL